MTGRRKNLAWFTNLLYPLSSLIPLISHWHAQVVVTVDIAIYQWIKRSFHLSQILHLLNRLWFVLNVDDSYFAWREWVCIHAADFKWTKRVMVAFVINVSASLDSQVRSYSVPIARMRPKRCILFQIQWIFLALWKSVYEREFDHSCESFIG